MSVWIQSFDPLPRSLSLTLPASCTASDILQGFTDGLRTSGPSSRLSATDFTLCHLGRTLSPPTAISTLVRSHDGLPLSLQVRPLLRGGKGGFGSQLRAAGGKMSSGAKNANTDACRDLNGRRLGVMREAKKLAAFLEGEEDRKRQLDEAQRKRYAKLERMLGRRPRSQRDFEEAAERMAQEGEAFEADGDSAEEEGSASGGSGKGEGSSTGRATAVSNVVRRPKDVESDQLAGSKRKERLDDSAYVEQSREIVENVRSAVAKAMMKKKKKLAAGKVKASAAIPSDTANAHQDALVQ